MVWSGRVGRPDVNGNDLINHQKRRRAGHYGLMDGDVPHDGDKPEGVTFVERRFGADQILQRHDRHQERIGVAHPVEAIIFEAGNGSVVALEERVELARLAKTQFGSASVCRLPDRRPVVEGTVRGSFVSSCCRVSMA